jgi:hypothetical protein
MDEQPNPLSEEAMAVNTHTLRRTLVATLAAMACLASVVPAASQAMLSTTGVRVGTVRTTAIPPTTMARATNIVNGTIHTQLGGTTTAVALEGHSTGDPGSAPEENCQALGNMANNLISAGNAKMNAGQTQEALDYYSQASQYINNGLDEGCFFID